MSDLKYSEKRRVGNLGEDIAEMFLVKRNFHISERNYLKKFGELDIIANKDNILHFIEVKSKVTREMSQSIQNNVSRNVSQNSFTKNEFDLIFSRETDVENDDYMPEDNVNFWKQKRMIRTIETYLLERRVDENQEWQIDVVTVKIDFFSKTATIKHIENVIFEAYR